MLQIDFDGLGLSRTKFMSALGQDGIGTQVHYIPVVSHPYYRSLGYKLDYFPVTQKYYRQALSIPLYYALIDSEQAHVIAAIRRLVQ